jgi:hypothetical protein
MRSSAYKAETDDIENVRPAADIAATGHQHSSFAVGYLPEQLRQNVDKQGSRAAADVSHVSILQDSRQQVSSSTRPDKHPAAQPPAGRTTLKQVRRISLAIQSSVVLHSSSSDGANWVHTGVSVHDSPINYQTLSTTQYGAIWGPCNSI